MIVRGYQEFLKFSDEVYNGSAKEGVTIELRKAKQKDFLSQLDYASEQLNISDAMVPIGELIESGKLPAKTSIKLYVSSHFNENFSRYITPALRSGNCPQDFKLHFIFEAGDFKSKRGIEAFNKNYVLPLVRAYKSGRCAVGLIINFSCPSNQQINNTLNAAILTYRELCNQQALAALVRGKKQNPILSSLPEETWNLICYFVFLSTSDPQYPTMKKFSDNLTILSASCFVENYIKKCFFDVVGNYLKFNSADNEFWFQQNLDDIIKSTSLTKEEKKDKIATANCMLLDNVLGGLPANQYKKSAVVNLAKTFHLIDGQHIKENPRCAGEFRLTRTFGLWKKEIYSGSQNRQVQVLEDVPVKKIG